MIRVFLASYREKWLKDPVFHFAIALAVTVPVVTMVGYPLRIKYWYPNRTPIPEQYPVPEKDRSFERSLMDVYDVDVTAGASPFLPLDSLPHPTLLGSLLRSTPTAK